MPSRWGFRSNNEKMAGNLFLHMQKLINISDNMAPVLLRAMFSKKSFQAPVAPRRDVILKYRERFSAYRLCFLMQAAAQIVRQPFKDTELNSRLRRHKCIRLLTCLNTIFLTNHQIVLESLRLALIFIL